MSQELVMSFSGAEDARAFFETAGYVQLPAGGSADLSFVKSLKEGKRYPRFHIMTTSMGGVTFDLHLDKWKHPHSGFYNPSTTRKGEAVRWEKTRVLALYYRTRKPKRRKDRHVVDYP